MTKQCKQQPDCRPGLGDLGLCLVLMQCLLDPQTDGNHQLIGFCANEAISTAEAREAFRLALKQNNYRECGRPHFSRAQTLRSAGKRILLLCPIRGLLAPRKRSVSHSTLQGLPLGFAVPFRAGCVAAETDKERRKSGQRRHWVPG